jgi:hypothetical protein
MQWAVVRAFLLFVALLCANAAHGQEDGEFPEDDDAVAREAAKQALSEGEPSAQERLRVLQIARKERLRAGRTLVRESSSLTAASVSATGVWVNVGPTRADVEFNGVSYRAQDSGRVRSIVPHPTEPGILYLATAGGGVWKTWDFGRSWEPITDQKLGSTAIGALALDPEAPDILYLGLGDPFDTKQPGLFRSLDGGLSWDGPMLAVATTAGTPATAESVRDIAVDPLASAHVFVATDVGLFVWDGSTTPRQVPLPLPSATTSASMWAVVWAGPGTWLASGQRFDRVRGTPGQGTLGLWRSIDDGQTWTDVLGGLPAGEAPEIFRATLAVAPSTTVSGETSRAFLLAAGVAGGGSFQKDLYRSEDGGKSFVSLAVNSSRAPDNPIDVQQDLDLLQQQAQYNQAIAVDPEDPNTVFLGGMFAAARSQDGGGTWSLIGEWLPAFSRSGLSYVHRSPCDDVRNGGAEDALPGNRRRALRLDRRHHRACGADPRLGSAQRRRREPSRLPPRLRERHAGVGRESWIRRGGTAGRRHPPEKPGNPLGPEHLRSGVGRRCDRRRREPRDQRNDSGSRPQLVSFARAASQHTRRQRRELLPLRERPPGSRFALRSLLHPPRLRRRRRGRSDLPHLHRSARQRRVPLRRRRSLVAHHRQPGPQSRRIGRLGVQELRVGDRGLPPALDPSAGGGRLCRERLGRGHLRDARLGTHLERNERARDESAAPPRRHQGGHRRGLRSHRPDRCQVLGRERQNTTLFDATPSLAANPPTQPVPDDYGHLFFTSDGGRTWQSVTGAGTLPNVPIESLKGDPNDPNVLYAGTFIGLYKSIDHGATFTRDFGLPFVKVTDICVSDDGSSIEVATYGRGIWQLNRGAGGVPAGARGKGDLDFDQKLDGFDLLDLVGALGTGNASLSYPPEADLVGKSNQIDDADLAAFLLRFGGRP